MNEFKRYHPIVNFAYFAFVIGFSTFLMHPVCLILSFCSAFAYSVMLKGARAIKSNLVYMLPMMLITAIVNPAFNHEGITILTYLPNGNPLTLESIAYGICAATLLVSVICHFSCYNAVMTSDKFIYLFGRVIPSLSLILSMTLRFVPRFSAHLKEVANSQKLIGKDLSSGSIIRRAKKALNILSITITWALENAIETSDSMKSRGYGKKGRTAFSNFVFTKRDALAFCYVLLLGVYVFVGGLLGGLSCRYFPSVKFAAYTPFTLSLFAAYFLLCIMPIIIEIKEVVKWKSIESKI